MSKKKTKTQTEQLRLCLPAELFTLVKKIKHRVHTAIQSFYLIKKNVCINFFNSTHIQDLYKSHKLHVSAVVL